MGIGKFIPSSLRTLVAKGVRPPPHNFGLGWTAFSRTIILFAQAWSSKIKYIAVDNPAGPAPTMMRSMFFIRSIIKKEWPHPLL
jgi:hypothetical protein